MSEDNYLSGADSGLASASEPMSTGYTEIEYANNYEHRRSPTTVAQACTEDDPRTFPSFSEPMSMEIDRATPQNNYEHRRSPTIIAQASTEEDPRTAATFEGLQKISKIPDRASYNIGLYDKHLLSQLMGSNLRSYNVNEPMGCAMLFSSSRTTAPNSELPAVTSDMTEISQSLAEAGWDLICRSYDSESGYMCSRLDSLNINPVIDRKNNQWHEVKDYSIFLFYYTGHGEANGVVLNDGLLVKYSTIVKKVASHSAFKDKPKIFVFDSCRVIGAEGRPYYQDIKEVHNEETKHDESYPPPHTMICFSATEGCASFMTHYGGSFYTLSLSHALRQFGQYLTVTEIFTQVNGGTREVASCYGHQQHPVVISNLDKQLVLNGKVTI